MKGDIVIDEIREIRHRMSAECGHDLERFFAMLKEDEKQFVSQIRRSRAMGKQYQEASAPREKESGK